MSALTSLLARDQIVPVRKIEEALQRQVVSGGAIETVLLEMGLVREDVLSAYRAALYGLLPATREEVMRAPREAVRALTDELARNAQVVPVSSDGRTLVLAAAVPPPAETLAKIEQHTRMQIAVRIVHEARLAAGLSHHYSIELEPRLLRLVEKLRRQDPGTIPYVKPPAGGAIAAAAIREADLAAVEVQTLPRGGSLAPAAPGASIPPDAGVTPAVARACRGPLGEERAQEVLSLCETREDVLFVVLRYASQFFEYSAMFSVQGTSARGRASRGAGVSQSVVRGLDVPLQGNGLFARAVRDKRAVVGSLTTSDDERVATAPMGRPAARPGMTVPVVLGTRVVLVLYVDRDGEALGTDDAEPLSKLMPGVGDALRRIIVANKTLSSARSSLLPGMSPSLSPPPVQVHGGSDPKATDAAPELGAASPSEAEPPHEFPHTSFDDGGANGASVAPATEASPEVAVEEAPPPVEEAPPVAAPVDALVEAASVSAPPEPVAAEATAEPVVAERPAPVAEDEAPAAEPPRAAPAPAPSAPISSGVTLLGVPRAAPAPPVTESVPPAPLSPLLELEEDEEDAASEEEAAGGAYSLYAEGGVHSERPGARLARTSLSARSIPRASAPPQLELPPPEPARRSEPSVVVDMGSRVADVVADLMRTSPEEDAPEIEKLLDVGEAALPELLQAFPGPLWFDRHHPHRRRPAARDISAVARAVMAFGERAAPYLASIVRDGRQEQSFYALMLAAELPHGSLVEPVARRMFDQDPGIAQLSLEVLRSFTHLPEFEMVLTALSKLAAERERPVRQQFALSALAQLGDARAAPTLLRGMQSGQREVATVAYEALVRLTCQDFGTVAAKWHPWMNQWGDAHRIEWLIESLVHADERLRSLAGAELTRITHLAFGFHPGLPRRDRELSQRKYRQWWEREGRSLWAPLT